MELKWLIPTQYTRLLCGFVAVQEDTMRSKHLVQSGCSCRLRGRLKSWGLRGNEILIAKKKRAYTAKLCLNIHENKEHLPVGDRLASLALSLHNDVKLAMEIPLVAQFIVCPREELYHVFTFQEEMVVTQEMMDESALYYGGNPQHALDYMEQDREIELIDFLPGFWALDDDEEPFDLDSIQTHWLQDVSDDIMQRFD